MCHGGVVENGATFRIGDERQLLDLIVGAELQAILPGRETDARLYIGGAQCLAGQQAHAGHIAQRAANWICDTSGFWAAASSSATVLTCWIDVCMIGSFWVCVSVYDKATNISLEVIK